MKGGETLPFFQMGEKQDGGFMVLDFFFTRPRFVSYFIFIVALIAITVSTDVTALTCYEARGGDFTSMYESGVGMTCEDGMTLKSKYELDALGKVGRGDTAAYAFNAFVSLLSQTLNCTPQSTTYTFAIRKYTSSFAYYYPSSPGPDYGAVTPVITPVECGCVFPLHEQPDGSCACPEGTVLSADGQTCEDKCAAKKDDPAVRASIIIFDGQSAVTTKTSSDGCYMTLSTDPADGNDVLLSASIGTSGTVYQFGKYVFTGESVPDGVIETNEAFIDGPTSTLETSPVSETPVYKESFQEISRTVETLPDGSSYEQIITVDTRTKTETVEYNQLTNTGGTAVYQPSEHLSVTQTIATTTAPDGSRVEQITTTTDYTKPPSLLVSNDSTGATNLELAGGGSSSTTNITTNNYAPDGTLTGSESSTSGIGGAASTGEVTGDPLATDPAPYESAGSLTGPVTGATGDETYTLDSFSGKISSVPIVSAVSNVFNTSLPSTVCPSLGFTVAYIGHVYTDMHCQIMQDFNSQFYILMIGLWVLMGAVIILRA